MNAEELFKLIESIRARAEPATRDALVNFERQLKVYVDERDQEVAAKDKEIADLKGQLEGAGGVTRASPSDLAKSFRGVIEEFHAEAREAEDVGVAIKALDLEVKGLVEVEEQKTTLVLPGSGTAVEPTALSTFRVSFGTVPIVPAEEAPEPEPPPQPRRRRSRPS